MNNSEISGRYSHIESTTKFKGDIISDGRGVRVAAMTEDSD